MRIESCDCTIQSGRKLKITTVCVTHAEIEAMTLADRVVSMEKALIQQVGTRDRIYYDPARLLFFDASTRLCLRRAQGRNAEGRGTVRDNG